MHTTQFFSRILYQPFAFHCLVIPFFGKNVNFSIFTELHLDIAFSIFSERQSASCCLSSG